MREPVFWWRTGLLPARLLAPLGMLYGTVAAWRMAREGRRAGVPVVCVGNYQLGGAGKTPTVLALLAMLHDIGEHPVVLSRGYGGRLAGPVRVEPGLHRAADVGDEPLLLAQAAPVIVARDRVAGAGLARELGASLIIMDDGLQNPSLHKDVVIAVIDGSRGVGNGAVFPAGPLRAPLTAQIARTDAMVVVGAGEGGLPVARLARARDLPVFHAWFDPDPRSVAALRGRRVRAFAGIGDPQRFFATLLGHGIDVVESQAFPDHHAYSARDLEAQHRAAASSGLTLVTTAKDLVRLSGDPRLTELAEGIVPFEVRMAFAAPNDVKAFLRARLRPVTA
ncbi:MAG: tetraacyldisaccharide 4'-kinase [Xanthobacteraceae bacterium]|nr:MAG: tetraacyldisaccharide 4'-kinase [Xanthobacteraceae bacterium]